MNTINARLIYMINVLFFFCLREWVIFTNFPHCSVVMCLEVYAEQQYLFVFLGGESCLETMSKCLFHSLECGSVSQVIM